MRGLCSFKKYPAEYQSPQSQHVLLHDLQRIPQAIASCHSARGGNGRKQPFAAFCPDVRFADKVSLNRTCFNDRYCLNLGQPLQIAVNRVLPQAAIAWPV